jgi:hypothetical protein
MIIYTSKYFSKNPVEVIADEVENAGIEDFEVSPKISKTNITITADPGNLRVYIPPRRMYDQYTIESFIRMYDPTNRASMEKEDGYVIMTFPRPIKMKTYIGLVEEIIEINGFCTILME